MNSLVSVGEGIFLPMSMHGGVSSSLLAVRFCFFPLVDRVLERLVLLVLLLTIVLFFTIEGLSDAVLDELGGFVHGLDLGAGSSLVCSQHVVLSLLLGDE